jgi:hypothetical protein
VSSDASHADLAEALGDFASEHLSQSEATRLLLALIGWSEAAEEVPRDSPIRAALVHVATEQLGRDQVSRALFELRRRADHGESLLQVEGADRRTRPS